MREIARTLGACVVDDAELQSRVIPLLEEQDQDARVRRSMAIEAIVLEAGLFLSHEKKRDRAFVGEFATITNGILQGRGEALELNSRAVGDYMRSLGLYTRQLGSAGRGILLLNDVRRKIHELAWTYAVRSIQDGIDRCPFCAEARSRFGDVA
ncbi:MAG: hypothetical protein WBC04_00315 [Candidatus Acidiferrales bacterium]